jgi:hypothetical protein
MRFYQSCIFARLLYVVFFSFKYCEQYVRRGRTYELTPPDREITRLNREQKELFNKALTAKAVAAQALIKANRYTKQRRLALKRIKELKRRKNQNILELKMDKILTDNAAVVGGLEMDEFIIIIIEGVILSGALNSLSPRFSFFFNPAFLDSPNKSAEMLQGNS